MTAPGNYPSANPGGEDTWIVRQAIKAWLDSQHIPGVGMIELTLQPMSYFVEFSGGDAACMLFIDLPDSQEIRGALTGPEDPGGKDIHYTVMLWIRHRGASTDDWSGSQRDYDRTVDAIKGSLRGVGRALGRPDVILQAGEWPRGQGITHQMNEPVNGDGVVDRWGTITFTVSQYLATFIPSAPPL